MGRVYFPTRNENGVRDLSKSVTLGYYYDDHRGPAEPAPKAAMNPVTLGGTLRAAFAPAIMNLPPVCPAWGCDYRIWAPNPPLFHPGPTPPPVASQTSPTPTVTVPPAPPPTAVLVSSGGGTSSPAPASVPAPYTDPSGNVWTYNAATGQWAISSPAASASQATTQSPTTSTVVAATPGLTDQVAAWLSGTTPIGSWNIPNALLAGGVILGAALFMGGGKKR